VADYRTVRADLGSNDDLAALADDLHERGTSLCVDLVLNHVAREHDWAVRARAGEERYRRFFRLFVDRDGPDAYEASLPEVFPDFAPGSFSFDTDEAIVGPRDLVPYLGTGRHHGKVSDLAHHNSFMVQVWSMLAGRDVRLAVHALRQFDPVPTTTSWLTYLRCHDDIGWAVDDGDAAAAGLDGRAHRAFLSDFYCGAFPGSFARGLVFQHDPGTGDRRICGTAADLAGLAAALALPEGPHRETALGEVSARLLLAHALVLGFGGIPVLWSGDELALRADPGWAQEPGHGGDNRWAHRPRLPWQPNALGEQAADRHDGTTVTGRVFQGLARLARVRRTLPHLHPRSRPRCSTRPVPACWRCCAATRTGRCSGSTT